MFDSCSDHWRKNIPILANQHRVYAIDLLGYGYSDKPSPRSAPSNSIYNFENWANQVLAFCSEIVKDSAFLICNSVGGEFYCPLVCVLGIFCLVFMSKLIRNLFLFELQTVM